MPNTAHVHSVLVGEKRIVLIGTAHVSRESADLVDHIIEEIRPDAVCVELCRSRYESLLRDQGRQEIDFLELIKAQKAFTLPWLMLWHLQKIIGRKLGIRPGEEILRAIEAARQTGAHLCLADRDIRLTLERAWRSMSAGGKMKLVLELLFSVGSVIRIKEEDIEQMKREDALQRLISEFGEAFPELRRVILDERDQYLADSIRVAPGKRVVAVVGAAHVTGILRHWKPFMTSEHSIPDSFNQKQRNLQSTK